MIAVALVTEGLGAQDPSVDPVVPGRSAAQAILDPDHIRAIVVEAGETDPSILRRVRGLGANTLITRANPDGLTARAAGEARLFYIARMSVQDSVRSISDRDYAARMAAVSPLAGVYYEDDDVEEGYAGPEAQQLTYAILKALFPGALILHPTRLFAIASDPAFLDGYFRPMYTDVVTPYFYPAGPTGLSDFAENDDWQDFLEPLLKAVAARTPLGKKVLPVLQGFERIGSPVDARLPLLQMQVYGRVWPGERSAALFAWTTATPGPLIPLSQHPELQRGVCGLFAALLPNPARCRWAVEVSRTTLP